MHFFRSSDFFYSKCLSLIFFTSTLFFPLTFSDPRISEAGLFCGHSRPPPNTTIVPTFVKEMEKMSQIVTNNNWGHNIVNATLPMYCLAQCFEDLSHMDCLSCYAASRTRLPRCLPALSGRLYLDGCFLRYDSYNFFNESVNLGIDSVNCSSLRVEDKREEFKESVRVLVDNVTELAVSNKGFGLMEVKGVFGLAQCWKSVSKEGCRECLEKAGKEVRRCGLSREGRGLHAGCYLRYSDKKFFNEAGDMSGSSGAPSVGATVGIAMSAAAFFMLSVVAAYLIYIRLSKLKKERVTLTHLSSFNKSSLTYKYETLEKSTNYFSNSRKLGEGASGSVFRAKLPNGETVAVKRLFFNTRQWVDEFFNEVNLISGIQHKNLVKLLGCSIEGPESLLVYEYVPKKSLDQFLFDKNVVQILNWKQRFNVIVGTAKGLAYLHGGSKTRIIHRDIKSSNVLLDEDLTPKIADFGLARCFGTDKTHLSTGIAGTLGYMAPEYLIRGQLTEKADVYSFGVLVLEIICGRKNISFTEETGSLLQTIWKLYKNNKLVEVVDPRLNYDFPAKEATNVLLIGLLCTQASAALRPSMDEVIRMLIGEDCEVPMPKQPPFLSSRNEGSASSPQSSSLSSLITSALTKIDVSYTSTGSSSLRSSDDHQ